MSCGIENRVPFLDKNLASFCFNLENKYKIRRNNERYIAKNSLNLLVKKRMFSKEKKAITDPQTLWMKTYLKEFILDNLHTQDFKEYEVLNSKKFIANFQKFLINGTTSFDIFINFSSFMFYKNFKKRFNLNF